MRTKEERQTEIELACFNDEIVSNRHKLKLYLTQELNNKKDEMNLFPTKMLLLKHEIMAIEQKINNLNKLYESEEKNV